MRHPRWVRSFMSEGDLDHLTRAIAEAEAGTSAEIRVHLDRRCPGDAMARAILLFERLGMHRTAGRNGVLVYAAIADHKVAVIGDEAIHGRVGEAYWQGVVEAMIHHFRGERPRDAFVHALREVGAVLREHFPRAPGDENELPDRVSLE